MGILTKIEEAISAPLEKLHTRKGFQPVDLARLAFRCLEQGIRKGIKKVYAPNRFVVLLHSADYKDLATFMDMICSDIKEELARIIGERDYLLAGRLKVEVRADDAVAKGIPQVRAHMESSQEPASVVYLSEQDVMAAGPAQAMEEPATIIMLPPEESDRALTSAEEPTVLLEPEECISADAGPVARGSAQGGGPLFAPDRLPIAQSAAKAVSAQPPKVYACFDLPVPGGRVLITSSGLYLENRNSDKRIRVNGQVRNFCHLDSGARLAIDSIEMVYWC